eukprot:365573-Chlamydomonas_euryale.AAC.4
MEKPTQPICRDVSMLVRSTAPSGHASGAPDTESRRAQHRQTDATAHSAEAPPIRSQEEARIDGVSMLWGH